MTCLAWDGETLASDSLLSTDGFSEGPCRKLHHLKSGAIFGDSGMADSRAVIALFDPIMTGEDIPSRTELEALKIQGQYLLILPDKTAWWIGSSYDDDWKMFVAEVLPVKPPFSTAGHGGPIARIAMSMGANAVDAVREACKHSLYCQEPIQVMTLDSPKEKIKRVRKPRTEPETTPVE